MKQNLPRVMINLFFIFTLTVIMLFVNVLEGVGSARTHSILLGPTLLQVRPANKDSVLKVIHISQSVEKTYRVQVCALRNTTKDIKLLEKACGQSNLIVEEIDGYYKYVTSSFTGYAAAIKSVNEVKEMPGFEGSFIVLYNNGIRIKPHHVLKNDQVPSKVMEYSVSSRSKENSSTHPIQPIVASEKKQISLSTLHPEIKSVISKSKNVIPSNRPVTRYNKIENQDKLVNTNNPFKVVSDFTNQYIPSTLLLFVLLFFTISFLILVLFLIVYHLLKIKRRNEATTLRELYANKLVEYWSDTTGVNHIPELFKEATSGFKKDILISEIIALLATLNSQSGNKIRDLYFKLELDFYSFGKLHNRKWNIKAMGIHELAALDATNEVDSIEEFINHPHPVLRHEAISAIVRLRPSDPFGFLDRLRVPFTKRDQINAIAVLKKHHFKVPDFSRWFDSYDPSVVVFTVEMVSLYKQTEASEHFDKLLRHSYEEVRMSVIKAIGDMYLKGYSTRLIQVFNDEREHIQLVILQTMGKLEDISLLNFLSDIVLLNPSMKVRMEASIALIDTGPQGLTRMQTLLLKQDSDISYIYHQIIG